MQNIGFVEKSDDDKLNLVKFLVDSAKGINTIEINKEDSMTDEVINEVPAEEVAETETVEIAPEADAEVVEEVAETEKAAMPEEEEDPEGESDEEDDEEVSKSADEETVNAVTELKDAVTSAFSEITTVVKSLSDEIAELKKSIGYANAQLADAENDFNNLGKRIDAVEADTAFRKSGDLGEIVQEPAMVEKSVWGGRFLNTSDLLK
jgi:chromosome segregation ATPase